MGFHLLWEVFLIIITEHHLTVSSIDTIQVYSLHLHLINCSSYITKLRMFYSPSAIFIILLPSCSFPILHFWQQAFITEVHLLTTSEIWTIRVFYIMHKKHVVLNPNDTAPFYSEDGGNTFLWNIGTSITWYSNISQKTVFFKGVYCVGINSIRS